MELLGAEALAASASPGRPVPGPRQAGSSHRTILAAVWLLALVLLVQLAWLHVSSGPGVGELGPGARLGPWCGSFAWPSRLAACMRGRARLRRRRRCSRWPAAWLLAAVCGAVHVLPPAAGWRRGAPGWWGWGRWRHKVALASSPGVGRAAWPLWLCVSGRAEGVVLWAASVQRAWASGGSLVGAAEPGSQPRPCLSLVSSPWGCAAPCLSLPWTQPCLACLCSCQRCWRTLPPRLWPCRRASPGFVPAARL